MEFLALIYGSEDAWESLSDDERQAAMERYMAFRRRTRSSAEPSSKRPAPQPPSERERRPPHHRRALRRGQGGARGATTSSSANRSTRRAGWSPRSRPPSMGRSSKACLRPRGAGDALLVAGLQRTGALVRPLRGRSAKASEESLPKWYVRFSTSWARPIPSSAVKSSTTSGRRRPVRVRDGEVLVTDGPFAETKEQIGGLFDIKLPDLDTALGVRGQDPAAEYGSIEVRPIVER